MTPTCCYCGRPVAVEDAYRNRWTGEIAHGACLVLRHMRTAWRKVEAETYGA